jgi:hypothetical protein
MRWVGDSMWLWCSREVRVSVVMIGIKMWSGSDDIIS